jgi:transposase-like protein
MAHPEYIRKKAIQLRVEKKLTIDEIAERLSLSKTTIYYWVKDIPIPGTEKQSEARKAASKANSERARLKREAAYQQGVDEFEELSKDPTFRDFICMYVGEGSKRSRNQVAICNSDPMVVKLGHRWIPRLSSNCTRYWLQHHSDHDVDEVCRFWGETLDIDPGDISFQRKSNSGELKGRTWRSPYGVLTVRSSDTYLRSRLEAWMDLVKAEWQ